MGSIHNPRAGKLSTCVCQPRLSLHSPSDSCSCSAQCHGPEMSLGWLLALNWRLSLPVPLCLGRDFREVLQELLFMKCPVKLVSTELVLW